MLLEDLQRPQSSENARRAKDELFGYQNSRKARLGGLAGLQDPAIMDKKRADEKALRDDGREQIPSSRSLTATPGTGSRQPLTACKDIYFRLQPARGERAPAFNSELFGIARTLVRLADGIAQAQRRAPARVSARPAWNRSSRSCSPRRRSTTTWRSPSWPTRSAC